MNLKKSSQLRVDREMREIIDYVYAKAILEGKKITKREVTRRLGKWIKQNNKSNDFIYNECINLR